MLNLKLITQLQGDATLNITFMPLRPGILRYYLSTESVNYTFVVTGECSGNIGEYTTKSFDVILSSISALIDKGYNFRLSYDNDILKFSEESGTFSVTPLFVEHLSSMATQAIKSCINFNTEFEKYLQVSERVKTLEQDLRFLKQDYDSAVINRLSLEMTSDSPFGESAVPKFNSKYEELRKAKQGELDRLKESLFAIKEEDVSHLNRLASIASRNNTVISLCSTYAVVELNDSYVFQSLSCENRCLQGKLLQRLLATKNSTFYNWNGQLVYTAFSSDDADPSKTFVFINPYLSSSTVDPSLVTRGTVQERYELDFQDVLTVVGIVANKFPNMTIDLGNSLLRLSNERGEEILYTFKTKEANTQSLIKAMKGEAVSDFSMSVIEVPRSIQKILPYFKNNFTVFIKRNKVIFKSDKLYAVFGI